MVHFLLADYSTVILLLVHLSVFDAFCFRCSVSASLILCPIDPKSFCA